MKRGGIMQYTKSAGVMAVVGGSVLYSSLTFAAVLIAGGALGVLFMAYRRRRHDRKQAGR